MTATATEPAKPALPRMAVAPGEPRADDSFAPVFTLVLWLGCLLVGVIGFVLPYTRPRPPEQPVPVLQAEILKVELTSNPAPAPANVIPPPPDPTQPPPLFAPATPPQAPQLVAVAQPSPAVAFALPIEAPARIVEVKQAAFVRPAPQPAPVAPSRAPSTGTGQPSTGTAPAPAVQTLVFGEGEGQQPKPGYPLYAKRAGQEGTVVVRLTVGTDGRVLAAEASSPSPWGALNREALRTVRERWRFQPGPVRLYDVPIRFELDKKLPK